MVFADHHSDFTLTIGKHTVLLNITSSSTVRNYLGSKNDALMDIQGYTSSGILKRKGDSSVSEMPITR